MKKVTLNQIQDKIQSLTWKKWLQRRFSPLVASFFVEGSIQSSFEKIGIPSMSCRAIILQKSFWYESEEVWQVAVKKLKPYLQDHSIFDITQSLDDFYKKKKKRIQLLVQQKNDPLKKFKEVYEILTLCTTYIWLAHILESFYVKIINKEVPKYIKKDVDKFIGDASFPKKKTVNVLMEEAMRRGDDPQKIADKFGWVNVRSSFDEPFNAKDIKKLTKEIGPSQEHHRVEIPKELKQLFDEVQELVFFRTARTDIFYELLFLSRPIIKELAKHYHLYFSDLKNYTAQSLIEGKPEKFSEKYTFAQYKNEYYFGDNSIVEEEKIRKTDHVKGRIAFQGIVKGTVKVVRSEAELDKVEKEDILVTQMTFPSFVIAMHRAAAFVTDEGGITCHAAIVAREMQKPCIVGTGKATKIFKDGDLVEVNADKGVVKIIKRAK